MPPLDTFGRRLLPARCCHASVTCGSCLQRKSDSQAYDYHNSERCEKYKDEVCHDVGNSPLDPVGRDSAWPRQLLAKEVILDALQKIMRVQLENLLVDGFPLLVRDV